jgi:hypothetical protein
VANWRCAWHLRVNDDAEVTPSLNEVGEGAQLETRSAHFTGEPWQTESSLTVGDLGKAVSVGI